MKIVQHKRIPKTEEVQFQVSPLRIWLDTHTEAVIQRGDRLGEVLDRVYPYFKPHMKKNQVKQLIAFWFAIGERVSRSQFSNAWTDREIQTHRNRKYQPLKIQ